MREMTGQKLLKHHVQPIYVCDHARAVKQPTLSGHYGRIRFFYEQLLAGDALDLCLYSFGLVKYFAAPCLGMGTEFPEAGP
jgi:hypothetical protein